MMSMKKSFFLFVFRILVFSVVATAAAYFLFAWLAGEGQGDFLSESVKNILGIASVVAVFCLVLGGRPFLAKVSPEGVKQLPWSKRMVWAEIRTATLSGIPSLRFFDRIILEGNGKKVELPLFVFKEPEAFLNQVKNYIPWAAGLDRDRLPSRATAGDCET